MDYICPTVTVRDKLNRSSGDIVEKIFGAGCPCILPKSAFKSALSFPLHIPLLTSFLSSKSLPLPSYSVHGQDVEKKTQHELLYGHKEQMNVEQICSHHTDSASMCDVHCSLLVNGILTKEKYFGVCITIPEVQPLLINRLISEKQNIIFEVRWGASITFTFTSGLMTIT